MNSVQALLEQGESDRLGGFLEFFNPGKLYGDLTIEKILSGNYASRTRNGAIARAFKEAGIIERYGSGIEPNRRSTFYAQSLRTSIKNIERWLKQLKDENKIEFRGAPKTGGYWSLHE